MNPESRDILIKFLIDTIQKEGGFGEGVCEEIFDQFGVLSDQTRELYNEMFAGGKRTPVSLFGIFIYLVKQCLYT